MDARDRAALTPDLFDDVDESAMTATAVVEDDETGDELTVTLPIKFEVCGLCYGKGSHVNPSIDAHGISADEFAEDPDFRESYFAGHYDVTCAECGGKRVVPVVNSRLLTPEQQRHVELLEAKQEADARYAAESAYERRMGY